MNPALIAVISGILSGAIVTFGNIFAQRLARTHESKQRFREIAVKAGMDNWRYQTDLLVKAAEKGNVVRQLPPEDYICHMLRLMDLASDIGVSGTVAATKIQSIGKKQ